MSARNHSLQMPRPSFRIALSIAFVVSLGFAGSAPASIVVFNNIFEPQVGVTAGLGQWSAQSFIVGQQELALDTVDVRFINHGANGDFFVQLYSSRSDGNPGTLLETLTGPLRPPPGTTAPFTYSSTGTRLQPRTAYFVVFGSTGTNPYAVGAEHDVFPIALGQTIGLRYTINSGQTWQAFPYQVNMRVTADIAPPVPVPGSLVLWGIGALGFALITRKPQDILAPASSSSWPTAD